MTQAATREPPKQSRAVRSATQRANDLMEEQRRKQAGEPAAEPAAPAGAVPAPEPAPLSPVLPQPAIVAAPVPIPAPPGIAPPVSAGGDPREHDAGYWKARFESTAGQHRADMARLNGTVTGQAAYIEELEGKLAAAPAAPRVVDVSKIKLEDHFKPEEIREFGADALRSLFVGVLKAVGTQVEAAVAPIRSDVRVIAKDDKQRRYDAFIADITKGLPNWEAVNQTAEWMAWLTGKEEVLTAKGTQEVERQDLLDAYHAQHNARAVVALFKRFLSTQPGGGIAPPRVETTLMPTGGPSGGAPEIIGGGDELKPVTRAEITRHFNRKARDPKVWARSEECKAAESRINAALAAGTVQD